MRCAAAVILLSHPIVVASCAAQGELDSRGVVAQEEASVGSEKAPAVQESPPPEPVPKRPPEPRSGREDWVLLTSGEWLKGELKYFRRDTVVFDSDELDELELDWDDVADLYTTRRHSLRLSDGAVVIGPIEMRDDVVVVHGEEEQRFARKDIVSIVSGTGHELDYWSGKLSLGVALRTGNTDQSEFNARANLHRRSPLTRLSLEYVGTVAEVDNEETTNNRRVTGSYLVYLTQRFYLVPAFVEYYSDRFSNIDYRFTPGAGVGYDIVRTSKVEWSVFSLGAYRFTRFRSVDPGVDATDETGVVSLGTYVDLELTKDIDFVAQYRLDVSTDDLADTNQSADATLSVELTDIVDLDVSFIWTRIGNPERGSDGTKPEEDDLQLLVGLGVEF